MKVVSQWSILAEGQPVRSYAPGQFIFFQGSEADHFYYVLSGSAKSFISSEAGDERVLTIHRAGDLMGEASFFDRCPRVSSAAALTECRVAAIDRPQLERAFASHPELAFPMLEYLAGTIRLLSAHVDNMSFRPANQRIARYLLEEFDRTSPLSVTQEEIGRAVGVSRVTVNRVLSELEGEKILSVDYRSLKLLDRSALERICEE